MRVISKDGAGAYLQDHKNQGIECKVSSSHPYLKWPDHSVAVEQNMEAGYINPRKLVEAQQKLAASKNCQVIDGVVVEIDEETNGGFRLLIRPSAGSEMVAKAKKVILAQGAYFNFSSSMLKVCWTAEKYWNYFISFFIS